MKKLSLILVFCLLFGLISGCDSTPEVIQNTQQYVLDCGATLTACADLKESAMDGFTTTLQGEEVLILLLDENKDALGVRDKTLEDYAQLVKEGNGLETDFSADENGNLAAEYVREVNGEAFYYYVTLHESGSSFWMCNMACRTKDKDQYRASFSEWSATLQLKDTEITMELIKEKKYTLSVGLQVTGPDGMREVQMEGFDAFLTDNYFGVLLNSESKPDGWTLEDYAKAVADSSHLPALKLNAEGVWATEYTVEPTEGMEYWYYLTVHETDEVFWICQFFGLESMRDRYEAYLPKWSAGVKSVS